MKFCINESALSYQEGITYLLGERGHGIEEGGIVLCARKAEEPVLQVTIFDREVIIEADSRAHFFRGLAKALQYLQSHTMTGEKHIMKEDVCLPSCGTMFDCSRNGVLKTDTIKHYIRKMAELGLNTLMLYMEDTYEIKEHPHFGYLRGRYTQKELKACDDYADLFGIEVIPCIQTLGHLHTPLRFPQFKEYKDTNDILLAGSEKVYELIEAMIRTVSQPFRSNKIHLGMDEAHDLGLGEYLNKHGFQDRFSIMNSHLKRVKAICDKYKLHPMIWSDMYFRLLSPTRDYYDISYETKAEEMQRPPEGVELMYWDYYHEDKEMYRNYFRLHKNMGCEVSFAGGGWIWNGLAPNYSKMLVNTQAALNACKEDHIQLAICTLWQDNGAETPVEAGEPALAFFAEHCFHNEVKMDSIKESFSFVFGKNWDDCMVLNEFDSIPGTLPNNSNADNPSKYLLYQDVMSGLFDGQIKEENIGTYYKKLEQRIRGVEKKGGQTQIFTYYRLLAETLSHKAELGLSIRAAYQQDDRQELYRLVQTVIPACIQTMENLLERRRELWNSECKPFGFEVIDIRFSGVTARLKSAKKRIISYLFGEITEMPEMEEERIPFAVDAEHTGHSQCSCPFWDHIVSAGNVAGI